MKQLPDKITNVCKMERSYQRDNSWSVWELLMKCIEKLGEVIDYVQEKITSFQSQLDAKEDSNNITTNRKLSENGVFTGKVTNLMSALEVVQGVQDSRTKINYLSEQFSDGQTGYVIDCGFFEDDGIKKQYDGGVF